LLLSLILLYFIEVYIYSILRKLTKAGENLLIFIRRFNYYNLNLLKSELYIFRFILKSWQKKTLPASSKELGRAAPTMIDTDTSNENLDTAFLG